MCIRDRSRTDSPDEVHEEQFFGTTALFGVFHAAGGTLRHRHPPGVLKGEIPCVPDGGGDMVGP